MSKKNQNKEGKANNKTPKDSSHDPSKKSGGSLSDRNDHRVPIQLLVDYKLGGHYLFDFCRDLGSGGVFIETKSPLNTGSEIELTFTIPDSRETLRTKGKVIWSQTMIPGREEITPGMGVQFTNFNENQRKTLDEFILRYGGKNLGSSTQRRAS